MRTERGYRLFVASPSSTSSIGRLNVVSFGFGAPDARARIRQCAQPRANVYIWTVRVAAHEYARPYVCTCVYERPYTHAEPVI